MQQLRVLLAATATMSMAACGVATSGPATVVLPEVASAAPTPFGGPSGDAAPDDVAVPPGDVASDESPGDPAPGWSTTLAPAAAPGELTDQTADPGSDGSTAPTLGPGSDEPTDRATLAPGWLRSDQPGATQAATRIDPPEPEPEPEPEPIIEQVWLDLAECESNQRWDYNGASGYDGGLQFHPRTWIGVGGDDFAPYAWQATPYEQVTVAKRLLEIQGWGAWPTCARKLGLL